MLKQKWIVSYFGACLGCDETILEAIDFNSPVDPAYTIWSQLPDSCTESNIVSAMREIMKNANGDWKSYFNHDDTIFFAQLLPFRNTKLTKLAIIDGDPPLSICEGSYTISNQVGHQSGPSFEIMIHYENEYDIFLVVDAVRTSITDKFTKTESLRSKILKAHRLLKLWKESLSENPEYQQETV